MAFVRHARREPAVVALEIVEHVAEAPQQVLALGLDGLAQGRRIGGEKIGGRQRVDELAAVEGELRGVPFLQTLNVPHRRLNAGSGQ